MRVAPGASLESVLGSDSLEEGWDEYVRRLGKTTLAEDGRIPAERRREPIDLGSIDMLRGCVGCEGRDCSDVEVVGSESLTPSRPSD